MVMKKTLLIAAAALSLSVAAAAQGFGQRPQGGRPDEATMIKMRTERMTQQLGLNEEQSTKLLELNQKYPNAMFGGPGVPGGPGGPGMGRPPRGPRPDENVAQGNDKDEKAANPKKNKKRDKKRDKKPDAGRDDARMNEFQTNREAYEAELKQILTEEQFKTWQESRIQRQQGRGPGGPGFPGGRGGTTYPSREL